MQDVIYVQCIASSGLYARDVCCTLYQLFILVNGYEHSLAVYVQSKYKFKVAKDANKIEIAQAAEALFHVEVVKVNTVNCTGKTKRVGRFTGKKADF